MNPMTMAMVRHFLTFAGGIAVTLGYMTEGAVASMLQSAETLVGILMTMGGLGLSYIDKQERL